MADGGEAGAATKPKAFKAEYAKSSRSSCKKCGSSISKDVFRIARVVESKQFDGYMTLWHHATCIFKKPGFISSLDDVEGFDSLRWEDQEKVRKYVNEGVADVGAFEEAPENDKKGKVKNESQASDKFSIEYAKSNRSTCKNCQEKIEKSEARISIPSFSGRFTASHWYHPNCFFGLNVLKSSLSGIDGWDAISEVDKKKLTAEYNDVQKKNAKKEKAEAMNVKAKDKEEEVEEQGRKRRKNDKQEEKGKTAKPVKEEIEASLPLNQVSKNKRKKGDNEEENASEKVKKSTKIDEEEALHDEGWNMEKQSIALWEIKDNLKNQLSKDEMKQVLSMNFQDSSGSEFDLLDRLCDILLFGKLPKCELCKQGCLEYKDGLYRCKGFLSAWSKCSFTTTSPTRSNDELILPENIDSAYLNKFLSIEKEKKTKNIPKPVRLLPKPSSKPQQIHEEKKPKEVKPSLTTTENPFEGLFFTSIGKLSLSQAKLKSLIESLGGHYVSGIQSHLDFALTIDSEIEKGNKKIASASKLNIPLIKEKFIHDCVEKKMLLDPADYKFQIDSAMVSSEASKKKVKVKGKSFVHEDSGLQENGHILQLDGNVYNVTLNNSDLTTGINSYYILQIIKEDSGEEYYLFRKWGRVGSKIGGDKLEYLDKSVAISEFNRLFKEKTGNDWTSWQKRENFQKFPGKFFPIEIDYDVDEVLGTKDDLASEPKTNLDSRLIILLEMIFDMDAFKSTLLEFEININQMPLGKLSKSNIQRGFEILSNIQNLLESTQENASVKESLIRDASNQFFTLIPTVNPKLILSQDLLKEKVQMLESLQDMEIASKLISKAETGESMILSNYKKLKCEIKPLDRDSEDFKLIEKYLRNTHAPTHQSWDLEIEDIFSVDREGENEKFKPFKETLENKMLLWHGSRRTNFVGILSQGLRIAPKEAPATGYMFGKGVYFADLVSKSAQYCYSSKSSTKGLMLLSEVALGKMHELKEAKYIEKLPKGTHSCKGLGKMKPDESEFVNWEENITVPCGKPIPSKLKKTDLQYNEYIVYDTSQVKLRFLLKINFIYKH